MSNNIPDLRAYLNQLEKRHEQNIKRRNITSICVLFAIFTVVPILLDIVQLNTFTDLIAHIAFCALLAVVYFFVNAAFFSLTFSESVKETYQIEQLRIQISKTDGQ